VSWDWQKRLHSEEPAPLPDDSSFGGMAAVASDQEQEPADAGETGRAEASTRGAAGVAFTRSAAARGAPGMTSTRGAGGMDWHPTGAAAKDGGLAAAGPRFAPVWAHLLQALYDGDVLEEPSILAWADEKEGAPPEERAFLDRAAMFVEWLRKADSEGGEEEESE